jgi:hypothetical protein
METQIESTQSQLVPKKIQMKYWLVDITLTSGECLQFYVKAITQHYAYEKADEYAFMAENNEKLKLMLKQFRLFS